jgi:hypothetical protein
MEKLAFTVKDFCEAHSFSRAKFYALVREGQGPRLMRVGKSDFISAEDAAEWRRRMTIDPSQTAPSQSNGALAAA